MKTDQVNVRYMVDDVEKAIEFYTKHLGFTLGTNAAPAFADVTRGNLACFSAAEKVLPAGPCPTVRCLFPGGGTGSSWWWRIWSRKSKN